MEIALDSAKRVNCSEAKPSRQKIFSCSMHDI